MNGLDGLVLVLGVVVLVCVLFLFRFWGVKTGFALVREILR